MSTKLKITLVELFMHHEVLTSFLRMLKSSTMEIHCLTTADNALLISGHLNEEVTLITRPAKQSNDEFLTSHLTLLHDQDLILFTTIDLHSRFLRLKPFKAKIIGLCHNANSWLRPISLLHTPKSRIPRMLFYWLRGDFTKARKILKKLDLLVLPSHFILQYLKANLLASPDSDSLEIAVPEFPPQVLHKKYVQCSIPGTINQGQRNYRILLDLLPRLDKKITHPLKLYLLGAAHRRTDAELLHQIATLQLDRIEIFSFKKNLPSQDFDHVMRTSDFLFLPIQEVVKYRCSFEYRGKTCVSGNINDMVRFSLPAVLPAFYPIGQQLEKMTIRYHSEVELENILVNFINQKTFNKIKDELAESILTYGRQVNNELHDLIAKLTAN